MRPDLEKRARTAQIKLPQAKYSYLPFALSSGEEGQWAVLCVVCVGVCLCVCIHVGPRNVRPCTHLFIGFSAITQILIK